MLHELSFLLLLLCSAIVAPATLRVYHMQAWGIRKDLVHNGDGYVKVACNNRPIGITQVKRNTLNPVWAKSFSYRRAYSDSQLKLKVYDKDVGFDTWLGTCMTTIKMGNYKFTCNLPTGVKLEGKYCLH